MKTKNGRKGYLILILISVVAFIYMFAANQDRVKYLNNLETKYTIGQITDFSWGAKTPSNFGFEFYINGEVKKSHYSITDGFALEINNELAKEYIGDYFFVKYSVIKPKYNELYFYTSVPDSLKGCFECSFDKVPFN